MSSNSRGKVVCVRARQSPAPHFVACQGDKDTASCRAPPMRGWPALHESQSLVAEMDRRSRVLATWCEREGAKPLPQPPDPERVAQAMARQMAVFDRR